MSKDGAFRLVIVEKGISRDDRHLPPLDLVDIYPAHVHIDLLPGFQGKGHGWGMMIMLFDKLAEAGANGVHLGVSRVNTNAIGFYRRLGMSEHTKTDDTLIMTLPLRDT